MFNQTTSLSIGGCPWLTCLPAGVALQRRLCAGVALRCRLLAGVALQRRLRGVAGACVGVCVCACVLQALAPFCRAGGRSAAAEDIALAGAAAVPRAALPAASSTPACTPTRALLKTNSEEDEAELIIDLLFHKHCL